MCTEERSPMTARGMPKGRRHRAGDLLLRMLAPHFAVLVFWCWRHAAWPCILAYHAQIVLWAWHDRPQLSARWNARRGWTYAAPAALAGPLMYVLLPHMTRLPVATWLATHGLSGTAWLLLVPYFGIVHPLLEEMHWAPLRRATQPAAVAHVLFASYHALVLFSLLHIPWVVACCVVLALASIAWGRLAAAARGGLLVPALSHLCADSSLAVAALLLAR
jgi:hypothetical protein